MNNDLIIERLKFRRINRILLELNMNEKLKIVQYNTIILGTKIRLFRSIRIFFYSIPILSYYYYHHYYPDDGSNKKLTGKLL